MAGTILVTGGAGFIGSNFVEHHLLKTDDKVVVLDKLTYAGNLHNLSAVSENERYTFARGDIGNRGVLDVLLERHRPYAIVNFAAETHVDRSIHGPEAFLETNVLATSRLLSAASEYFARLATEAQGRFRFVHISTDEVYGSLGPHDPAFSESTAFAPNSPYSASKAASDHLVRAWHHTYNLPVLTTNCSNNYGPKQFPEKLIPLLIDRCLRGEQLPIYGDGANVRDWLYVDDHCDAISRVLREGKAGETYNIGGENEIRNIDVATEVCRVIDELRPRPEGGSYASLITFVHDRPGHDRRYAVDISKIKQQLGWKPMTQFESGIRRTVQWYLQNADWVKNVTSGRYRDWLTTNYEHRGAAS